MKRLKEEDYEKIRKGLKLDKLIEESEAFEEIAKTCDCAARGVTCDKCDRYEDITKCRVFLRHSVGMLLKQQSIESAAMDQLCRLVLLNEDSSLKKHEKFHDSIERLYHIVIFIMIIINIYTTFSIFW